MSDGERRTHVLRLLNAVEVLDRDVRMQSIRAILYLTQGTVNTGYITDLLSMTQTAPKLNIEIHVPVITIRAQLYFEISRFIEACYTTVYKLSAIKICYLMNIGQKIILDLQHLQRIILPFFVEWHHI